MIHKSIVTVFIFGIVAFLLFALLFAYVIWGTSFSLLGTITREVGAVFHDLATQWMAVLCLAYYFIMLLVLKRRLLPHGNGRRLDNADFWLCMSVGLVLLGYAWTYATTMRSMQIPVLMTGIVFGMAISFWMRRQTGKTEQRAAWLVVWLMILLAGGVLWQPEVTTTFQYHGELRWSGIWDNPNFYGLLMGTGLVLATGIGIREWQKTGRRERKILCVFLCLFAAILTGYGLFKSYSRGAWLAFFAGLIYTGVQAVKASRFSVWFRRNWLPLTLLAASLFLLAFWQFRFSELRPAQRVFSITNANDFSWRNRVTAWEGAVRMMVDRPLTGFGWGQAEADYGKKYCPPRLNGGAAIETNDYFMISISAGVPALFCFAAYLALSFRNKPTWLSSVHRPPFSIFTTARAGSIVLLVGFWFDGGLFKLPVAIVFWTLMELSRLESFTPPPVSLLQEAAGDDARINMAVAPKRGAWEMRLSWFASARAVCRRSIHQIVAKMPNTIPIISQNIFLLLIAIDSIDAF